MNLQYFQTLNGNSMVVSVDAMNELAQAYEQLDQDDDSEALYFDCWVRKRILYCASWFRLDYD